MKRSADWVGLTLACALTLAAARPAHAGYDKTFEAGSLIIPMDLTYQDQGMLQAYGLLFQLLRQGVKVHWVIDPAKTWHHADCDTMGDECTWDCKDEGSGVKCAYPTASPDFFASAKVVWDDQGTASPDDPVAMHGYRGGPFVIDAADHDAALGIMNVWNDPSQWTANPWADRTVFNVVTVHEATGSFSGHVRVEMLAAPTIAVFSDGNEDIATSYLRAAGIPQSNGNEFPDAKCNGDCGPGTNNPDMLTVPSIMGDMGTCDNINYDHKNGSLFTGDGLPAYCQIMSMHWNVNDRETVQCDGGRCPATQAECTGQSITYHGHEVVAEVRQFLQYPVHFFAECQAVNAYENTVPNPDWPYLDDDARRGHFLTTEGTPPACPCSDADFECVIGGCGGTDCCLPKNDKEKGAGFLIAAQPNSDTLKFLNPYVAYAQLDGRFQTIGGSEPAYNLSTYLMTQYINNLDVTLITGPSGPGDQDLWMTGYIDGECDIGGGDDVGGPPDGQCNSGKVSYLGGHAYKTNVPMSSNGDSQGARLFLNALFEADCVSSVGQPDLSVSLSGDLVVPATSYPVERSYIASYTNGGRGFALDGVLTSLIPTDATLVDAEVGSTPVTDGVSWSVGSISGNPVLAGDPPESGGRQVTVSFPSDGDYQFTVTLDYRVGLSTKQVTTNITVQVRLDGDGDGVPDETDPFPADPNRCGDSDSDGCDDCSSGHFDPANDGCGPAGNDGGPGGGEKSGGCCQTSTPIDAAPQVLVVLFALLLAIRRRRAAMHPQS